MVKTTFPSPTQCFSHFPFMDQRCLTYQNPLGVILPILLCPYHPLNPTLHQTSFICFFSSIFFIIKKIPFFFRVMGRGWSYAPSHALHTVFIFTVFLKPTKSFHLNYFFKIPLRLTHKNQNSVTVLVPLKLCIVCICFHH